MMTDQGLNNRQLEQLRRKVERLVYNDVEINEFQMHHAWNNSEK